MDVKLLTFHRSLSYGGCLQTIATIAILEKLGCDVTIIDYENEYEARNRNGKVIKYCSKKEIVTYVIKAVFFKNEKMKKNAFGEFPRLYPKLTKKCADYSDLNKLTADAFVIGSDQVWNEAITNGLDSNFYLGFGESKRRISIASSMGSYVYDNQEICEVQKLLCNFHAISVREQFAKNQIKTIVEKDIRVLLDPTLLFDGKWWVKTTKGILSTDSMENYILAFVINGHSGIEEKYFMYYKNKYNLPIYRIRLNTFKGKEENKVIAGVTPYEFVQIISKASFVITDSFHGMAFSINLNIPFAFLPVEGNNDRMSELLNSCNLNNRVITENYKPTIECDFKNANSFLSKKRKEDIEWIRTVLTT